MPPRERAKQNATVMLFCVAAASGQRECHGTCLGVNDHTLYALGFLVYVYLMSDLASLYAMCIALANTTYVLGLGSVLRHEL